MVITVDGPSGVGKGTLSRALAQHFSYDLLDSGAIYRLVALSILNQHIDLDDVDAVVKHSKKIIIKFVASESATQTYLAGENVTTKIRTEECAMAASKIATYPALRESLLAKQRNFAINVLGLIADGRDMGTVVFPNAKHKFYLEASSEIRAKRRFAELQNNGENISLQEVLEQVIQRDFQDKTRSVAPLEPAVNAIIVDTSNMPINEVLAFCISKISQNREMI